MGQSEKNSARVYVFRFAFKLRHWATQPALRICAKDRPLNRCGASRCLMHLAVSEATMRSMTDDKVKRRLTTVLCADVHGYSRLMGADEAGTLGALRRHRSAIAGLVERHDGRIVNTWGDAVIAEFASVVEAVQCAVEIQQEISNQDSDPPHAHQMRFRIGINLGDVMVDGSDIFGDGVNIAARLQELAEPGGVVVSASVYDQVHNKLSLGFDCLGQQQMKNVVPVISYRVTMGGVGRHRFPVDELHHGSVSEPASPHCSDPHSFGLSDSNQCLHRSAPNLVSLASRSVAVHWHPAHSAPAQTCFGPK